MVLDTRRVQLSVFEDSVQYYLQDDTNWPRIGVGAEGRRMAVLVIYYRLSETLRYE